jgi:hypothetical protein
VLEYKVLLLCWVWPRTRGIGSLHKLHYKLKYELKATSHKQLALSKRCEMLYNMSYKLRARSYEIKA